VPYAIICRIEAGNEETRKSHTHLVVIELDGARSAVIGHAEGANEEAEARAMADRTRPKRYEQGGSAIALVFQDRVQSSHVQTPNYKSVW
jgi:hypothetical protein